VNRRPRSVFPSRQVCGRSFFIAGMIRHKAISSLTATRPHGPAWPASEGRHNVAGRVGSL